MKRSVVVRPRCIGAASAFLPLSLLLLAGCSDDSRPARKSVEAGPGGLHRSEIAALKKAAKNPQEFEKLVMQKRIEKLKKEGVVVESSAAKKVAKKVR